MDPHGDPLYDGGRSGGVMGFSSWTRTMRVVRKRRRKKERKGRKEEVGRAGLMFGRSGATHLSGVISPLAAFHRVSL